jgi:DeoR family transcriptional regulator, suf operon transcriptional repressor
MTATTSRTGSAAGGVAVAPPLPSGRRGVLYAIRRLGDATADDLAGELDITVSGARQHLTALADQGLVASVEAPVVDETGRRSRGRPSLAYHVTELADALFPKAYAALTNELLGYLEEESTESVDRMFARRRDHRIAAAQHRLTGKKSLTARVAELADILDEDGYMATAEPIDGGAYRIVEHNCAIASVARRYGQACSSEIDFIRAVLPGTTVERVTHMVAGDRHCGYEVRPERTATV